MSSSEQLQTAETPKAPVVLAAMALVAAAFAWAYRDSIEHLLHRWSVEPEYSHGFFVPPFAAVLLWLRWDMISAARLRGSLWGLALLGLGGAMRLASAYFYYDLFDPLSLLPTLAGIALFIGGWHALRWAWPSIVYLIFMIPLPGLFAGALSGRLQLIATSASVYALQMIGIPATARGNVIALTSSELEVAQACSGLRMLLVFFATSTAVAFLAERRLWEKVIVLLSAVPIAVISNVIRIVATGIAQEYFGTDFAINVFHDQAGYVMMPMALVFLWLELNFLDWLVADADSGAAQSAGASPAQPTGPAPS